MQDFNDKQIQILQVAETLFANQGFDGTSIRDIAKAAEINIAMISYYFGSKEKLLESLIYFRTSDLIVQIDSLSKETCAPIEKINKLVSLYILKMHQNQCIYQIIQFEFALKKRMLNQEPFSEVKKMNLLSLQLIIEEGQKIGVFKSNIRIPLIASTILGTYLHFQMNRNFLENILDIGTEEKYNLYVQNELINHIQQTIKALLTYESK